MNSLFSSKGSINQPFLQDVLDLYYHATGVPVFFIDEMGQKIASAGEETLFCDFFLQETGNACPCHQTHLYASRMAYDLGDSYVFYCPAGMVHYSAPVSKENLFAGALIGGPLLMTYPDELLVDEIVQKYRLAIDRKGRIASYLQMIMVVGPQKVRYLSQMLFVLATHLCPSGKNEMDHRRAKIEQQSRISESIHFAKEQEHITNYYPYEKEKMLIGKVKAGDIIGSRAILNELLGHVFLSTGGNLEIIKARILELCTLLSRAAVEGGASLEKIFGLNFRFISSLSKIDSIEELSFWTLKVLDRFTESVFDLSDSKHASIMQEAINYINENYHQNVTLESVAGKVHLNQAYFSTIFKKETGVGFSDYLNKVRIEESKKLLKNREMSILDVAIAVGFETHSYFSKVFKKVTGVAPSQYRSK